MVKWICNRGVIFSACVALFLSACNTETPVPFKKVKTAVSLSSSGVILLIMSIIVMVKFLESAIHQEIIMNMIILNQEVLVIRIGSVWGVLTVAMHCCVSYF